ncbi:MAG: helix-turn-helix transcriptional regulator, partial [Oscillospiraceae bacterium]|nr:helix-turn-helix transcriptional regulator [Oscillospiraceae bacterium]
YEQAREVIRYNERTGRNLSSFGRMDTVDQVMLYPLLTDEKISNYMTLGRAQDAKDVIMGIYKEYFGNSDRILSLEAIDFIKYRITNTVLTVAERQGAMVSDDAQKLLTEKNTGKYFTELTALVDSIVDQISSKKSNAQNMLAIKVNDYIHDNYADSGLTIKQIAAYFHFHENYVSNLFKEEYGENLSTAIEKIRIEKACELLGMTETKVGDVAEAIGYSSDSSFRRAFKKITGVSPVDYRNSH